MSEYVTDTHALLWHLTNDSRLSAMAQAILADADAGVHQIHIPSIVLVEVVYLAEKLRIDPSLVDKLLNLNGRVVGVEMLNVKERFSKRDLSHVKVDIPALSVR